MRTLSFLATALAMTSALAAGTIRFPNLKHRNTTAALSLTQANHYGTPIPAWEEGYNPGWYYGNNPSLAPGLPWLKDKSLCTALNNIPDALTCPKFPKTLPATSRRQNVAAPPTPSQVPPPPGVYYPTFSNLTAAIEADDFLTFGLVDTVQDCKAMCDGVSGCGFVNTYHDVNGKDGSPLLTCSLYASCHGPDQAINTGGQSQPDGSLDFITDSDGFCKQ